MTKGCLNYIGTEGCRDVRALGLAKLALIKSSLRSFSWPSIRFGMTSWLKRSVLGEIRCSEAKNGQRSRLLLGGEVTLAGADLQVFLDGADLNGTITAVGIKVCRMVGNYILAAQFVFNGGERALDVLHLEGEEGTAPGRLGKLLEDLVAAKDQAAVVRGNCVNDDLRTLSHFDRLLARMFALVVFAIADHDQRAADRMIGIIHHSRFARAVSSVIERGAPAILKALNAGLQKSHVIGVILGYMIARVKAHDEGIIVMGADRMLKETGSRFLFKLKTTMDGTTGVD